MPTKTYQIKPGYPVESLVDMATRLGQLTETVVVCTPVIQVEAAEPVLKALDALLPTAKRTKGGKVARVTKQAQMQAEPAGE